MKKSGIIAAGVLAVSAVAGGAVQAGTTVTKTCAELSTASFSVFKNNDLLISVVPGDIIAWDNATGTFSIEGHSNLIEGGKSGTYTASSSDTVLSVFAGQLNDSSQKLLVYCTPKPAPKPKPKPAPKPTASGATGDRAGSLGAASQARATFSGIINNSDARFGNGGAQVTSNRVFVSTSGKNSSLASIDWNAWASVSGRSFAGGTSGSSADIVAGVDRMVGPDSLVGVLLGFGTVSLTDGTTPATATTPMAGVYFGTRASSLKTDGFVSLGTSQTTTNGATFNSPRQEAGLSVSKDMQQGNTALRFVGKVTGFAEAQPSYVTGSSVTIAANTISKMVASVGVRMTFQNAGWGGGFTPYLSGNAEYSVISETATGVSTFASPRFGFGVSGPLGGGTLSVDIDAGRARADTVDTGVKLRYDLRF